MKLRVLVLELSGKNVWSLLYSLLHVLCVIEGFPFVNGLVDSIQFGWTKNAEVFEFVLDHRICNSLLFELRIRNYFIFEHVQVVNQIKEGQRFPVSFITEIQWDVWLRSVPISVNIPEFLNGVFPWFVVDVDGIYFVVLTNVLIEKQYGKDPVIAHPTVVLLLCCLHLPLSAVWNILFMAKDSVKWHVTAFRTKFDVLSVHQWLHTLVILILANIIDLPITSELLLMLNNLSSVFRHWFFLFVRKIF